MDGEHTGVVDLVVVLLVVQACYLLGTSLNLTIDLLDVIECKSKES